MCIDLTEEILAISTTSLRHTLRLMTHQCENMPHTKN